MTVFATNINAIRVLDNSSEKRVNNEYIVPSLYYSPTISKANFNEVASFSSLTD